MGDCRSAVVLRKAIVLVGLIVGTMSWHERPMGAGDGLSKVDRGRGCTMLKVLKSDLEKYYYDPAFRGMDLDARFKQAEERVTQAKSVSEMFAIIAQVLIELDDSHTYFVPPARTARIDYGWEMQAVGDKVYVSLVRPGSDAEAKGLKRGDEVLGVDNYTPTRENLWKLSYVYNVLRPQGGAHVVLKSPAGQQRELDVAAKVRVGKHQLDLTGEDINEVIREVEDEDRLHRDRHHEVGEVFIWKMPRFGDESSIDNMMKKAAGHSALILDLRGNPGGAVSVLKRLTGQFHDHKVKIGDLKGRKETNPLAAESRGAAAYKGKLFVLVDSGSASASELFARVVQLEKRGMVIGDRTAGAVMEGRFCDHQSGADAIVLYGFSVTDADVIMSDGKSLEKVGVAPDELLLPTASDLAAERDPVLARAVELAGGKITPEEAGRMFPVEWMR